MVRSSANKLYLTGDFTLSIKSDTAVMKSMRCITDPWGVSLS